MFRNNVHTSPGTLFAYQKIYQRAIKKLGSDDALARDLQERAKLLSKATVRQYRAAYTKIWSALGRDDLIDAIKNTSGERQVIRRTAAKKAKAFRWSDLLRLLSELETRGERLAAVWLRAGYITGLRPSEWRTARLEGGRLIVQNGKFSNGRAHGVSRAVDVCSEQELKNIAALILHLRVDFKSNYDHVRYAIRMAAKKLWPKRERWPSLYTTRHMFSAEIKNVYSKVEVAALMGHATDRTAGQHYARRTSASGALVVRPASKDVAAVKAKAQSGIERKGNREKKSRNLRLA